MEFSYRTETRHHPQGKVCHHFARFKLTCNEFDELRERAAGACEICLTPESQTGGSRLVIDHFSSPTECYIRGLLCDRCNTVMACFDGTKKWGQNRIWEPAAQRYAESSWQTAEDGHRAAALRGPIDRRA